MPVRVNAWRKPGEKLVRENPDISLEEFSTRLVKDSEDNSFDGAAREDYVRYLGERLTLGELLRILKAGRRNGMT